MYDLSTSSSFLKSLNGFYWYNRRRYPCFPHILTRGLHQDWFLPQPLLNCACSCFLKMSQKICHFSFRLVHFQLDHAQFCISRKELPSRGFFPSISSSAKGLDIVCHDFHQSCNQSFRCHLVYAQTAIITPSSRSEATV
jgi:hypothetical protein